MVYGARKRHKLQGPTMTAIIVGFFVLWLALAMWVYFDATSLSSLVSWARHTRLRPPSPWKRFTW